MEVHAPEHPIHTWREFLRHILIVTVGILIALSLEGALEWRHHRSIARQARENILRELAGNQKSVRRVVEARERLEKSVTELLKRIDGLEGAERQTFDFTLPMASLSSASWNTAQVTGALSYMDYEVVEHLASIYDVQQAFVAVQQQTLRDLVLMSPGPGRANARPEEFDRWREKVLTGQASYRIELQFAQELDHAYDATLTGKWREVPESGS